MKKKIILICVSIFVALLAQYSVSEVDRNQITSIISHLKLNQAQGEYTGTVRKPKPVLCSECGNTHYNTECEGTGDGCDPTGCPYQDN